MPTFIEALPERLSSKHGAIKWTPSTSTPGGPLTIDTDRARVEYIVAEFATDWAGRAFHLVKLTDGTDPESESYAVFCSASHPANDSCDCKGFTFKHTCKHIDAARALLENSWL